VQTPTLPTQQSENNQSTQIPTPTNASSDSNKYSDELMLVFNKKKNSINNNQNTPFEYTVLHTEEVDNTMIGLEGYINTESLNHIDFEKEKENHRQEFHPPPL
jgi:hypothetical protein